MRLDGYPWARLNRKGSDLTERAVKLDPASLSALGVDEVRAFTATPSRVVLYVFGFDSYSSASSAGPQLIAALERAGELHQGRDTITGGYLLVAGFAEETPEPDTFDDPRVDYLSAFAGEE
jgi:hypothetical protein